MRRSAFAVAGVIVAVGCVGVGSLTGSTDSGPDAGSPADGAAPIEGGLDGTVLSDGGSGVDGWIPCAQRALYTAHFCDDFDSTGTLTFRWDTTYTSSTSVIGDTDAALSAPRAAVLGLDASTTLPGRTLLAKNRAAGMTVTDKQRILISYWIRVDKPVTVFDAGTVYLDSLVVDFDTPPCATSGNSRQRELSMTFEPNGTTMSIIKGMTSASEGIDGGSCPDFVAVSAPLDYAGFTNGFHHVTIEITKQSCTSQTGSCITLGIDDLPRVQRAIADPFPHANTFSVLLGPFAGGAFPDISFAYDNVTIDVE